MNDYTEMKSKALEIKDKINNNTLRSKGNQEVIKDMLGIEDLPLGIYKSDEAPNLDLNTWAKFEGNGYVAFIQGQDSSTTYTKQQVSDLPVFDGYTIPSNKLVQFMIDNGMVTSSPIADSGNWQYWTSDSLESGLSGSSLIMHLNPLELKYPVRYDVCKLKYFYTA